MMATLKKSQSQRAGEQDSLLLSRFPGVSPAFFVWFLVSALLVGHSDLGIAQSAAIAESHSNRFHRVYLEAKAHSRKLTNDADAAWQYARACFDRADFAVNDDQRAVIAEEGISASRRAVALQPKSAAGHYYLALNLGQLAQTKLLGALKLIDGMEEAWKKTIELDAKFDYAGAHRSLTLLYRDAPGWPTSVGSRSKARLHIQKALELCPEYPGNQICWHESHIKWGESKTVRTKNASVEERLRLSSAKFTGEQWARDWEEWEERWRKVKAKVGVASARSPRHAE